MTVCKFNFLNKKDEPQSWNRFQPNFAFDIGRGLFTSRNERYSESLLKARESYFWVWVWVPPFKITWHLMLSRWQQLSKIGASERERNSLYNCVTQILKHFLSSCFYRRRKEFGRGWKKRSLKCDRKIFGFKSCWDGIGITPKLIFNEFHFLM